MPNSYHALRATPEQEDFRRKYEQSGLVGQKLIDGYFRAVQDLSEQALSAADGKRQAVEVGCGEGFSTVRLRKMLPARVRLEASEYVEHQIPEAKRLNPGMRIIQEDAYELRREDDSLDLVYLLEVLEHLDYPDRSLAELKRVVKPGGYLILGVPRESLWRVLNVARGKYLRHLGNTTGHLNHWSKRSLIRNVESGFGPVVATKSPLPWMIVLAQKST
ncbi:class I SAM-dependent methyltransferase [Patescibacteria group bacterium]|nr:class I SAM-dependent methyltransferase [Patescibacteria group bacterium]